MATQKVFLTFPQRLIKDPVLYDLVKRFDVQTNIRGASVTDEIALVALQIDGGQGAIDEAIAHLRSQGVTVELLDG
jgi:ABC-type methionine transport system ATPase subunit